MYIFHVLLTHVFIFVPLSVENINSCNSKTDVDDLAFIEARSSDRILSGIRWRLKSKPIY